MQGGTAATAVPVVAAATVAMVGKARPALATATVAKAEMAEVTAATVAKAERGGRADPP